MERAKRKAQAKYKAADMPGRPDLSLATNTCYPMSPPPAARER